MKNRVPLLSALLVLLLCAGCRVRDVRTARLVLPAIRNEACLKEAEKAMRMLPDSRLHNDPSDTESTFRILEADFATGTLLVRYDAMKVGVKNLEYAVAQAGLDTPTYPADETARRKLPAACSEP